MREREREKERERERKREEREGRKGGREGGVLRKGKGLYYLEAYFTYQSFSSLTDSYLPLHINFLSLTTLRTSVKVHSSIQNETTYDTIITSSSAVLPPIWNCLDPVTI